MVTVAEEVRAFPKALRKSPSKSATRLVSSTILIRSKRTQMKENVFLIDDYYFSSSLLFILIYHHRIVFLLFHKHVLVFWWLGSICLKKSKKRERSPSLLPTAMTAAH